MKKVVILFLFLALCSSFVFAGTLSVTNEHPFLIKNEWIPAKQLVVGDLIQTYSGKARITKIEKIEENIPVYNLEDSYFHNYVVTDDNLVVHNSDNLPIGIALCFTGDTLIKMADGSEKEIKNIKKGDRILSWNFEMNKSEANTVREITSHFEEEIYKVNDIYTTKEHPFWTDRGWAAIDDSPVKEHPELKIMKLEKGMKLFSERGGIEVREISISGKQERVYNMEVSEAHNYFAGEVLVHNAGNPCMETAEILAERLANLNTLRPSEMKRLNELGARIRQLYEKYKTDEKSAEEYGELFGYVARTIAFVFNSKGKQNNGRILSEDAASDVAVKLLFSEDSAVIPELVRFDSAKVKANGEPILFQDYLIFTAFRRRSDYLRDQGVILRYRSNDVRKLNLIERETRQKLRNTAYFSEGQESGGKVTDLSTGVSQKNRIVQPEGGMNLLAYLVSSEEVNQRFFGEVLPKILSGLTPRNQKNYNHVCRRIFNRMGESVELKVKLGEIGRELGVEASRVSQIYKELLELMIKTRVDKEAPGHNELMEFIRWVELREREFSMECPPYEKMVEEFLTRTA